MASDTREQDGSQAEDDYSQPGDTVIELRRGVPWIRTNPEEKSD